ncbi:MAG: Zn-dependent alcohol dehydrogenase [Alphaproteobacteria bacterium]|nr:Zn-dependent alcohol dehydrogenase [Alphaproteobacteria bacterium]MDP6564018.1 Zn-dependent alcohol dehydrogenase [Alphaproteobacteria bacterium]MDP6812215.1 Zn-dependent alcohol dehydrogenase [Alphaproteobacteria bacterium]
MKAKAAVMYKAHEPLSIEEIDIDKPTRREVLIRTAFAGVCHSDLHFIDGLYPIPCPCVLGHESAGVVEAVGEDVTYVKPGDHVITCLSTFCGECEYCLTGRMSLCLSPLTKRAPDGDQRLSLNGEVVTQFANLSSYAEYILTHEHSLVKVREDMPLDRAALIGCGVMTGVGAVFHTAKVEPGSTVAVIGCGGIGLAAINGAAIAGAGRIIAVDMVGSKLNLAKEFGATDVVDGSEGGVVEAIRELTGGGVHYSFECVGLKDTAEQAFKMLQRGGCATVIGMIPVGTKIELHGPDFLGEKKIQGSAMGSNRFRIDMPRLTDFYLRGDLKLDTMISGRIKLEQINDAMDELKTGEIARNVIAF